MEPMLRRFTKRRGEIRPEGQGPDWPHIDIIFLDRGDHDETDTCFQAPVVPRVGEYITLDGYFRRRGGFLVERVEYLFCCERRQDGWARDVGVYVKVFVRPVQPNEPVSGFAA